MVLVWPGAHAPPDDPIDADRQRNMLANRCGHVAHLAHLELSGAAGVLSSRSRSLAGTSAIVLMLRLRPIRVGDKVSDPGQCLSRPTPKATTSTDSVSAEIAGELQLPDSELVQPRNSWSLPEWLPRGGWLAG